MAKIIHKRNKKNYIEEKILNLKKKNYKYAEKYLKRTSRKLKHMGNCYYLEEKHELAIKYFEIVIGMENGGNMQNYYWMGFILSRLRRNYLAVKYFQKAANGGYVDAFYTLGCYYTERKEYKLAEYYLKKSEENKDKSSSKGLGDLYTELENYELAGYYYEKGNKYKQLNLLAESKLKELEQLENLVVKTK